MIPRLKVLFSMELRELFPGKPKWTTNDVPDLTGKVVCVTGGNTGIGYETCKALLERNATVYLASRSQEKGEASIARLLKETGKRAAFLKLDLADLMSVRSAAKELLSKESRLDILFHNAGVMAPPKGSRSAQGYELQWATHVLGPFVFTTELLPLILSGGRENPSGARIVWVSSFLHKLAPDTIDFDNLWPTGQRDWVVYGQSKAAEILLSTAFAHKYSNQGILSLSVNPGIIKSDIHRHESKLLTWLLGLISLPASYGAITQLYVGTSLTMTDADSGKYFTCWARQSNPKKNTQDVGLALRLWEELEKEAVA